MKKKWILIGCLSWALTVYSSLPEMAVIFGCTTTNSRGVVGRQTPRPRPARSPSALPSQRNWSVRSGYLWKWPVKHAVCNAMTVVGAGAAMLVWCHAPHRESCYGHVCAHVGVHV